MLHIVNGAATLNVLDRTDIRGARVSGDDIFAEGPVTDRLETPASWRLRAEYLHKRFNIAKERYLEGKQERERSLRSFAYHEEVVLWFEFDLFCQMNLLFLLNWFAHQDLGNSRLSLICPSEYPGVRHFKGLGTLTPKQLAALFDTRAEITEQQRRLGQKAWSAYSDADPTSIERLQAEGTEELPYLRKAFRTHLERFPSVKNGLNVVETRILEVVGDGSRKMPDLFHHVSTSETVFSHGMGDLQFSAYLAELAGTEEPLIRVDNFPGVLAQDFPRRELNKCVVRITDLGKQVLKAKKDAIAARGVDRWLGGVHLKSPGPLWRWDSESQNLVLTES